MKRINILFIIIVICSFVQIQPASAKWFDFHKDKSADLQIAEENDIAMADDKPTLKKWFNFNKNQDNDSQSETENNPSASDNQTTIKKWFNFRKEQPDTSSVETENSTTQTDNKSTKKWFNFHKEKPTDLQVETETYKFPLDDKPVPFNITNDTTVTGNNDEVLEAQVIKEHDPDEGFGKDIELKSQTVDFYTETRQYVAKGDAKLFVADEKMEMYANEIILDQKNYEIIGIGNVRILKDGAEYFGDYIRINTKKESSFFTHPILYYTELTVEADTATMYADETYAQEGSALVKKKNVMVVSTTQFGEMIPDRFFNPKKEFDSASNKYKVVAKKIEAKRVDDRTDIIIKDAKIYRGGKFISYSPVFTLSADKDTNYIETIVPEMGTRTRIGTYIAPAIVFGLPNASAAKIGPLVSINGSDFGVGVFGRLSTPKSKTNLMYSSATGNFLVNASYKFTDDFSLNVVGNDYIDNGWMGGQLPNYGVELAYDKRSNILQANTSVRNRLAAGFYDDNKDYGSDSLRTLRYSWQVDAQNSLPILGWERYLMLGYSYQHAFNLYQTGDTNGIVRAGPRIYTDLGRLSAEVTYFMGGEYGDSPFHFDRYRYGKNNIRFKGQYYVNKYLSLGYHASINVTDRDNEDDWLTENQLLIAVGTEDLKLRLGFDTVRNTTVVGFDMLLGSTKTVLEFDEMKIKDLDTHVSKNKDKKQQKENVTEQNKNKI